MDNLTETKLTSEKIYSGCILDFYRDTVRLPNGGTAPRELSRHVGAVCIVPLLDDGRVIVERQFHCSDRKSTRLNSSHVSESRMPSSA